MIDPVGEPADVVLVRVSCDQEIQNRNSVAAQIGLDSWPHVLCAAVDEHVLSSELEQFRVSLAHVDEVDSEILAR
jgi:hypothetical protein